MEIPRSGVLEEADLGKILLGWSTALDDKHTDLFHKAPPPPPSSKDVDILCRASVPKDWSSALRSAVIPKLEPMRDPPRHHVAADQPGAVGRILQLGNCSIITLGRMPP